MNSIIVGCSKRKRASQEPLAALDLYEGGCVPWIRRRADMQAHLRECVFILSAQHGLLGANDPILPYDHPLSLNRAGELRSLVWQAVQERILMPLMPAHLLIIAEPLYFLLLADMLAYTNRPLLHWIPDLSTNLTEVESMLNEWGWPQ